MQKTLDDFIEEASNSVCAFERILSCRIFRADSGIIAVGRMLDAYHDMTVSLLVDREEYKIIEARAKFDKAPYDICRATEIGVEKLKGIGIFHPAVLREIRRAIKRNEGCTHLFELVEHILQTLYTGGARAGKDWKKVIELDEKMAPEQHRKLNLKNPRMRGTCAAFNPEPGDNDG